MALGGTMDSPKAEIVTHHHSYFAELIRQYEGKAALVFAGSVAWISFQVESAKFKSNRDVAGRLMDILATPALVLGLLSFGMCVLALIPQRKKPGDDAISLLIRGDELLYTDRLRTLDDAGQVQDLARNSVQLARICRAKHDYIVTGIACAALSIVFYAILP